MTHRPWVHGLQFFSLPLSCLLPHCLLLRAGLLCLATARTGGQSSWCSSVALYNEMLRRDPALVHTLLEPLYVDRKGEIPEGKLPHYQMAVFHWFEVRLLHGHLRNSLNITAGHATIRWLCTSKPLHVELGSLLHQQA